MHFSVIYFYPGNGFIRSRITRISLLWPVSLLEIAPRVCGSVSALAKLICPCPCFVSVPGPRLGLTSARLEEGQWGRESEAGGGSTISAVKTFPFKIEIKRLEIKRSFASLH